MKIRTNHLLSVKSLTPTIPRQSLFCFELVRSIAPYISSVKQFMKIGLSQIWNSPLAFTYSNHSDNKLITHFCNQSATTLPKKPMFSGIHAPPLIGSLRSPISSMPRLQIVKENLKRRATNKLALDILPVFHRYAILSSNSLLLANGLAPHMDKKRKELLRINSRRATLCSFGIRFAPSSCGAGAAP